MLGKPAQVECHQISRLANFNRADFVLKAQCACAIERSHAQCAVCIQCRGRAGNGFGQQGGSPGFAEQIQVIIAGGPVGANRDIDAGLPQSLDRAEAAGQFQVGFGAMDDAGVAFYQQAQVLVADLSHVHGLEARAQQAQPGKAGDRAFGIVFDRLLHFKGGFVYVHLHGGIELVGNNSDFLQVFVADCIGRVGAESDFDAWVVLQIAKQLYRLAQGFIRVTGARNRKVQDREGDLCADPAVVHAFTGHLREKIHVTEAGNAAFDLFGNGQIGAVAYKGFVDPFGFGRPDVVFKPGHQGQVIGHAAEQGHRRMAVGIDQSRAQQHVREFAGFKSCVFQCQLAWADENDASVLDAYAMILEHNPGGFNRY